MIAALPSGFAPSPEDAASAVATLGFFFVMLQELKNNQCIYIHMPGLWSSIFPPGATPRSATPVIDARYCAQGLGDY